MPDGFDDELNNRAESPQIDPDQDELAVIPSSSAPEPPERPELSSDGTFKKGRLAGLSMNKAIWVLAWPVVVESFLNSLVGLVDTAFAASMDRGAAATDAIGGGSYAMWLIGLIIMALGVGATALVSRSVGKGRMGVANAILGQTLTISIVLGVIVGVCVALGTPLLAWALNMSELASGMFLRYMLVIAAGVPAMAVLFSMIACSRGAGDSVSPLYAMIVRNIVNIAISWLLSGVDVMGFVSPLGLDLGITGIALGTVAGDLVGAILILSMARSGRWSIRLKLIRMAPHWITVRRLVRLGIPNFLETFGLWFGNFFVVFFVGLLARQLSHDGLLGAHIIAIRIEAFSFLPGFAMGMAAASLAGQYLGMRRPDLAKIAIFRCTVLAAALMGALGIAFVVFPGAITRMLSEQPLHLELVPPLLVICGVVQIPFAISIVFRAAMRGAGDVRVVMALTWMTTYAIRLPLAYFISGVDIPLPGFMGGGVLENPRLAQSLLGIEPGLSALWIALCSEMTIRGGLFSARFYQGGWRRSKV